MNNPIIFSCWKSDDLSILKRFEQQIEMAIKMLSDDRIFVDLDSSKKTLGANELTDSLLKKISKSSVFVADLSIVVEHNGKSYPNSNVCFELGYAVNALGKDRIILYLNSEKNVDFSKLPFDINHFNIVVDNGTDDNLLSSYIVSTIKELKGNGKLRPIGFDTKEDMLISLAYNPELWDYSYDESIMFNKNNPLMTLEICNSDDEKLSEDWRLPLTFLNSDGGNVHFYRDFRKVFLKYGNTLLWESEVQRIDQKYDVPIPYSFGINYKNEKVFFNVEYLLKDSYEYLLYCYLKRSNFNNLENPTYNIYDDNYETVVLFFEDEDDKNSFIEYIYNNKDDVINEYDMRKEDFHFFIDSSEVNLKCSIEEQQKIYKQLEINYKYSKIINEMYNRFKNN